MQLLPTSYDLYTLSVTMEDIEICGKYTKFI